jgi:hypothetical protein
VSLRIPSSSQSPDHDPHRTIYYLGYPLGRFAGLKQRYPEVPVKWTRPAKSSTDLQVGPETLSMTPATLEDLGRPYLDRRRHYPDRGRPARLAGQAFR